VRKRSRGGKITWVANWGEAISDKGNIEEKRGKKRKNGKRKSLKTKLLTKGGGSFT